MGGSLIFLLFLFFFGLVFVFLQTIGTRFEEVALLANNNASSTYSSSSSRMDTGDDDHDDEENNNRTNVHLEAEYVSLFGNSVSHCVEELSVLSYMLVEEVGGGNSKENNNNEGFGGIGTGTAPLQQQFCTAIDQVAIETKGVGLLSNMNDGPNRVELVRLLCAGMKER